MSLPVAAVVVSYESGAQLPACLAALSGEVAEAVVVDNGSRRPAPPALRRRHPEVRWIDNPDNRGFAAAANQGAAATAAEHILLLNPDCELLTGLEALVNDCRREGVAGAGGLLVSADGSPQTGFCCRRLPTPRSLAFEALGVNRAWPSNPVNRRYRMLGLDPGSAREVEQPAGAFLLLRRDAFEQVGGLDEGFRPLWFEDVDLCRRLLDAGYRLRFNPAAAARHAGGHSVGALSPEGRQRAWYGGMLRYAGKHFPPRAHRRVRGAALAGLLLRGLYCLAGGGSFSDARACWAACRSVLRDGPAPLP